MRQHKHTKYVTRKSRGLVHPDSELDARLDKRTPGTPSELSEQAARRGIPAVSATRVLYTAPKHVGRFDRIDQQFALSRRREGTIGLSDITVRHVDDPDKVLRTIERKQRKSSSSEPKKRTITDRELQLVEQAQALAARRAALGNQSQYD